MLLLLVVVSCGGGKRNPAPDRARTEHLFTLPELPSALKSVEEKTYYLAEHFWDNLTIADTSCLRTKPGYIEHYFLEYIDCLTCVDERSAAAFVKNFLCDGKVGRLWMRYFLKLADDHLYNVESPVVNEALYLPFAESAVLSSQLSDRELSRYMYRIEVARKNNPGNKATDFAFVDADGRGGSLYGVNAELLLVVFYDPECVHCNEVLNVLKASETIGKLCEKGGLVPMLVYTEGNREVWDKYRKDAPKGWMNCFDSSESVRTGRLYELRAMPSMYLLDGDKNVILKDVLPDKLLAHLAGLR